MGKIVDQFGQKIQTEALAEPQTSRVAQLQNVYLASALDGLTPGRLASVLRAADNGDLAAQHRLFADMEQRDAHLSCEIGKRKNALLTLDWDIVPPLNATAAEKADAEWLKEVLTDAVDPIEDVILALMDGPGHGFAPVELEWRQEGRERLPAFHPRPQEWFQLDSTTRRELRLIDGSVDGAPLWAFGWIMHTHGKAKTGYLGRMGLHRVNVWPFLYKAYAVGDFAEFLETYGLPIVTGKYPALATGDEKDSLFRAVVALAHDARAIMPQDMQIEIQKVTGGGDGSPHMTMVDWADRAQSKAVLGQVLSAEAKATGLGSGLADVHNEVRKDIRAADARQVAGTLTRDLLYPLRAINRGGEGGLARCPRFRFDLGEPDDIGVYGDALPKLSTVMQIPAQWAHEKLRIPMAKDGEAVLKASSSQAPLPPAPGADQAVAANSRVADAPGVDETPIDPLAAHLDTEAAPALDALLAHVRGLAASANSLPELQDALLAAYGTLPAAKLREVMALGLAVGELAGRSAVADGK